MSRERALAGRSWRQRSCWHAYVFKTVEAKGSMTKMPDATTRQRSPRPRPGHRIRFSWSDQRVRSVIWQVVIVGAVMAAIWWLVRNTAYNLETRGIVTGFGFLDRQSGLPITEHLITYSPTDTFRRALIVGLLNTLKVTIVGIILATILGTLIGVARLSKNWLLSKATGFYVEAIRDVPLLLQLFMWYALLRTLPGPRQALNPIDSIFLSNRGLTMPRIEWIGDQSGALIALTVGILATLIYRRSMRSRQRKDGRRRRVWPMGLLLVAGLPVAVAALTGTSLTLDVPRLQGYNFRGGMVVSPEYFALLLGLVIYASSYIAEIVRAGILAVSSGQREAALALALRPRHILTRIVLPQALRVIVPPMTNQYLNLLRSSALAVAIGYQDIVSIANSTLNLTGQAIEGVAIIMIAYLSISLSISVLMNWFNSRIALIER
ncbi:MAG: ABC transporter permease subunit [Mesorhizobium sp.]